MIKQQPYLLYADKSGNIFEDTSLLAVGRSGNSFFIPELSDFIQIPEGSDLFHIPGRKPIGYNPITKKYEVCKKGSAVAAFSAPAYTLYAHAAWENSPNAVRLPLYAYSAVGWYRGRFYIPAQRIDSDIRQDADQFDQKIVTKNAKKFLKQMPENRLVKHLSHCALVYFCPAARNYFLNRWEAPLPTSPSCNSRCMGCISFQPKAHEICSTQQRITFVPTPQEIAEIAVKHIESAPNPVVSFGQGCEGEPLMVWETLRDAIILIRKQTQKGIINLNTNASNPTAIDELCKVGLQSIRVSINSSREDIYNAYYNPKGYTFSQVMESISVARSHKAWVSLNYFVFPGVTDTQEEFDALLDLLNTRKPNMIQWRNFNIDPDWYLSSIPLQSFNLLGIKNAIANIKSKFPYMYHGYFNPGEKIIKTYNF